MKADTIILFLYFILICIGALFFRMKILVISVEDKWFATILALLLGLVIYVICKLNCISCRINKQFFNFSIIVSISCCFLAIYGILQAISAISSNSYFGIAGGFDNPAGYAASISAGFPMILYLLNSCQSKYFIGINIFAALLMIIAVALSGSRAGMLSMAVMIIFWLILQIKVTMRLLFICFASTILLLFVLYICKKDSADGRLLIWQCSWEMIKEKPVTGHGMGGFRTNYMNYQAHYFRQNSDSDYVMLADNINRPFNEFIMLVVNFGLVGFVLFIFLSYFLIKSYKRNPCDKSKIALCSLLGMAVFSCFSYPLSYPFVWVMILFATYVIISLANYSISPVLFRMKKLMCLFVLCLSLAGITYISVEFINHIAWGKTVRVSLIKQTDKTFAQYEKLFLKLKNNYLFLYNYAAELNYGGSYKKSQQIAQECSKYLSDYELQLLMGDNCVKMKEYERAEIYFQQAAYMCPVRFVPLYELMKIYQLKEERQKTKEIAERISCKPVKIPSERIERIKKMAHEYLDAVC